MEARVSVSFGYDRVCGVVDKPGAGREFFRIVKGCEVPPHQSFFEFLSRPKLSVLWLDSRRANSDVHGESKKKSHPSHKVSISCVQYAIRFCTSPLPAFSKEDLDRSQTGFSQLGNLTKDEFVRSRDSQTGLPALPVVPARKGLEDRP